MSVGNETNVRRGRVRWPSVVGFRRLLVLAAGITGLLALLAGPAQAGISMQHCEPLQRR